MNKEIEYVDLEEETKVVLVIEMTKPTTKDYKFICKRLKLNTIEKELLDKFIEDNLK